MDTVKKHAVPALIMIGTVLIGIYVLRKAPIISPITGPFVDKALNG